MKNFSIFATKPAFARGLKLGALALAAGLGYVAHVARADVPDNPDALVYSGIATDGGGLPLTGSPNIGIAIWTAETAGTKVCERASTATPVDVDGRFRVTMDDCIADIYNQGNLWVEVSVGGTALGRSKIGAVPYALAAGHALQAAEADNAAMLEGSPASAFQKRVAAAGCNANSSIRVVDENGVVTCEADDDTKYTAGAGLSLSGQNQFSANTGYLQRLVTGTCDPGESISEIDASGAVVCEVDDDTTYTAGTGLSLSPGNQFSAKTSDFLPSTWCTAGQALRGISGTTATCDTLPKMTAWTAFTPALRADGNAVVSGINTNFNDGMWRRVGDTIEVMIATTFAADDEADAKHVLWDVPGSVTPRRSGNSSFVLGTAIAWTVGSVATACAVEIETGTAKSVYVYCDGVEAIRRQELGPSASNWHTVSLRYSVPIVEWTLTTP